MGGVGSSPLFTFADADRVAALLLAMACSPLKILVNFDKKRQRHSTQQGGNVTVT
jgi:hypothetical protein